MIHIGNGLRVLIGCLVGTDLYRHENFLRRKRSLKTMKKRPGSGNFQKDAIELITTG
jgi:hypothetical protein